MVILVQCWSQNIKTGARGKNKTKLFHLQSNSRINNVIAFLQYKEVNSVPCTETTSSGGTVMPQILKIGASMIHFVGSRGQKGLNHCADS